MHLISLGYYSNFEEADFDRKILAKNQIQSFFDTEKILEVDFIESEEYSTIELLVESKFYQASIDILRNSANIEDSEKLEIQYTLKKKKSKITCPKCGSNNIYKNEEIANIVLNKIITFFAFNRRQKYVCYYCENEFKI